MRSVIALSLLGLSLTGCARGAPPGFSKGTTWTFPLVDPLANGKLLTPVFLDGRGPFLFAIDPDAPFSQVDRAALPAAFPYRYRSRVIDEQDTSHPIADADVREIRIGDLTISLRDIGVSLDHTFDSDGRRIYGILGRDVIADSLVFSFDRAAGVATLTTEDTYHAPATATVLAYHKGTPYTGGAVIRRLVDANVDGATYELHMDLGETPNQLRQQHWVDAKLTPEPLQQTLIDETGTRRQVTVGGIASQVAVDGVQQASQTFLPYDDRRWAYGQLEGTLGLDFFAGYAVAADWHHEKYLLTPQADTVATEAQRRTRWGQLLPACAAFTGCVSIAVAHPVEHPMNDLGLAPDHAPVDQALLTVTRDPSTRGTPLEVEVRTVEKFPSFFVHIPANVDSVSAHLEPRYASATLIVTDVSPFPRACAGGCVTAR